MFIDLRGWKALTFRDYYTPETVKFKNSKTEKFEIEKSEIEKLRDRLIQESSKSSTWLQPLKWDHRNHFSTSLTRAGRPWERLLTTRPQRRSHQSRTRMAPKAKAAPQEARNPPPPTSWEGCLSGPADPRLLGGPCNGSRPEMTDGNPYVMLVKCYRRTNSTTKWRSTISFLNMWRFTGWIETITARRAP